MSDCIETEAKPDFSPENRQNLSLDANICYHCISLFSGLPHGKAADAPSTLIL